MRNRKARFIPLHCLFLFFLIAFWSFAGLSAATLDEAASDLIDQLRQKKLSAENKFEMVLDIVNYDTRQFDREGREIQAAIYSALQSRFPEADIILLGESLAGVSSRAVKLSGTYRFMGELIELELRAINASSGMLIVQANASYDNTKTVRSDLVLVLPIEAPSLSDSHIRTFSKVLRVALIRNRKFNLISSDVIDLADVKNIQEEYNCSREECGTIIAEQFNASFVIAATYSKIEENLYFLTGSVKNINTGESLIEELVEHNGDLGTLKTALEQLACLLSQTCGEPEPLVQATPILPSKSLLKPTSVPELIPAPVPEPIPEPEYTEETDTRITIGIPTDFSIDYGIATHKETGESTLWGDEVEIDKVEGWKVRWTPEGKRGDFRFHMEILEIDAKLEGNNENWLDHTMLNIGWKTTSPLIFGFGFGFVSSEYSCSECTSSIGSGYNYNLEIGFGGENFGIIFSLYYIKGTDTVSIESRRVIQYEYGSYHYEYTTEDYEIEWEAQATTVSLMFAF